MRWGGAGASAYSAGTPWPSGRSSGGIQSASAGERTRRSLPFTPCRAHDRGGRFRPKGPLCDRAWRWCCSVATSLMTFTFATGTAEAAVVTCDGPSGDYVVAGRSDQGAESKAAGNQGAIRIDCQGRPQWADWAVEGRRILVSCCLVGLRSSWFSASRAGSRARAGSWKSRCGTSLH